MPTRVFRCSKAVVGGAGGGGSVAATVKAPDGGSTTNRYGVAAVGAGVEDDVVVGEGVVGEGIVDVIVRVLDAAGASVVAAEKEAAVAIDPAAIALVALAPVAVRVARGARAADLATGPADLRAPSTQEVARAISRARPTTPPSPLASASAVSVARTAARSGAGAPATVPGRATAVSPRMPSLGARSLPTYGREERAQSPGAAPGTGGAGAGRGTTAIATGAQTGVSPATVTGSPTRFTRATRPLAGPTTRRADRITPGGGAARKPDPRVGPPSAVGAS